MTYYVVKYSGPFGYIKPWTAVRDGLTYSQQFLTPSTLSGISQKLFGLGNEGRIARHKLQSKGMSEQQEQTQAKILKVNKKGEVQGNRYS